MFCKKGVLKSFAKFTGKQLWQILFLDKVSGLTPATWDHGTSIFLWILQNFQGHLFYRKSRNDCFWHLTLFLPTFSVHVSSLDLPVNATLPGSALTLQIFKNATSFLQVLQDSCESELFVEKLKVTKILTKFCSQF